MSFLHALILSLLQGAFELFPVSSLGHTVLVPALLGWDLKQSDPSFLAFVVVLHLGTAIALLIFFWRDWLRIIGAVLRSIAARRLSENVDERTGWLLVAGSIPAGVLGLFFKKPLNELFARPSLVAVFLVLNGVLLLAGERLRRRRVRPVAAAPAAEAPVNVRSADGPDVTIARSTDTNLPQQSAQSTPLGRLGFPAAFGVGAAQAMALLPGFSRSGASMVGGLLAGLDHVDAARLSFLLATPLIFAAALLETPELFKADSHIGPELALMGMVISGVTAYLAVRFLLRFFETERLDVFGYYCLGFGIFSLVVLALRG